MNHVSKEQIDSKSIFTILSLKAEANIPYIICVVKSILDISYALDLKDEILFEW